MVVVLFRGCFVVGCWGLVGLLVVGLFIWLVVVLLLICGVCRRVAILFLFGLGYLLVYCGLVSVVCFV